MPIGPFVEVYEGEGDTYREGGSQFCKGVWLGVCFKHLRENSMVDVGLSVALDVAAHKDDQLSPQSPSSKVSHSKLKMKLQLPSHHRKVVCKCKHNYLLDLTSHLA